MEARMWWVWLVSAFAGDTWARVANEAPLYAHAGDPAPITTAHGHRDYLFAVVSQRDGWVELRNSRPKVRPCEAGQLAPNDASLTLWTPAASLLPVATRFVHVQPEADVSLDVWPGWVAGSDPLDAWALSNLPKDLFGTTFVIPEGAVANARGALVQAWDGQLRIGGEVITLPPRRVDSAVTMEPAKFWLDGRCLSVTAAVANDPPVPGVGMGGFGIADFSGSFDRVGLRVGTALLWPDGTDAGRVVDELLLADAASAGGLTCGTWRMWGLTAPEGPRVCVPTSALAQAAFGTTDPNAAVVWSAPGGFSKVPRSVLADALVALEPAVKTCLSGFAPRSEFAVTFPIKDGAVEVPTVKPTVAGDPVPTCLAAALQKIVLPPKSSGRPSVGLRWNGG